jgi:biopolymer transport protein ExbD
VPKVAAAHDVAPGRGRGRRVSTSLAEINVVPMVDVMLVLLIIFMVAAPMIQQGIDVHLPVSRRSTPITGDRVDVAVPSTYRRDHRVFIGKEAVPVSVLQERIRQKMESATKKEVFLRGDRDVTLGELMEVFDLLKAAGVETLGIVNKGADER